MCYFKDYTTFPFEYMILCIIHAMFEGIKTLLNVGPIVTLYVISIALYYGNPWYCCKKDCGKYIQDLCVCNYSKQYCFSHQPYYHHDTHCQRRFTGLFVFKICEKHNVPKDISKLILKKYINISFN